MLNHTSVNETVEKLVDGQSVEFFDALGLVGCVGPRYEPSLGRTTGVVEFGATPLELDVKI